MIKSIIHSQYRFVIIFTIGLLVWGCTSKEKVDDKQSKQAIPVVVVPIERGAIDSVRVFSGSLEASQTITVYAKVGGFVESVLVDIGDVVKSGQLVVRIDDAEYKQALEQAKADLMVAEANLAEAESSLEISNKSMARTKELKKRGVSSEAELDGVKSELVGKEARVSVFKAQLVRAKATLKKVKIQLGYAKVNAEWNDTDNERIVAERFIDEGVVVTENTPLMRIVELSPVTAVFFVPENAYGSLSIGQTVSVATDAFAGKTFDGVIERIAPVFQDSTRQARVEVQIANDDKKLKPGMFIRARVTLDTASNTIIVPGDAIVTRADTQGVFVVSKGSNVARWQPVTPGIRHGDTLEVHGDGLEGSVVTLGQQLITDGTTVSITTANGVNP